MNTPDTLPCPCGSGRTLQACCGRYHAGELAGQAPDAEALMRSRYSAFVLDRLDYLLASWHASTRPPTLDLDDATLDRLVDGFEGALTRLVGAPAESPTPLAQEIRP